MKITKYRDDAGHFVTKETPGAKPVEVDFDPERDDAGHFTGPSLEIDDVEDFFDYEDYLDDFDYYEYHGTGDTGKKK